MPPLCKERSTNDFDEVVVYLGENDKGEKFLEDLSIEMEGWNPLITTVGSFFTLVRRTEPREEKITNYLSP
jgi:hypothetical protein